jgi:hypothetical protein
MIVLLCLWALPCGWWRRQIGGRRRRWLLSWWLLRWWWWRRNSGSEHCQVVGLSCIGQDAMARRISNKQSRVCTTTSSVSGTLVSTHLLQLISCFFCYLGPCCCFKESRIITKSFLKVGGWCIVLTHFIFFLLVQSMTAKDTILVVQNKIYFF